LDNQKTKFLVVFTVFRNTTNDDDEVPSRTGQQRTRKTRKSLANQHISKGSKIVTLGSSQFVFKSWSVTKTHALQLLAVVAAIFLSSVFTRECIAAPVLNSMQTAEQWEQIAKIRQQIAINHEVQSGNIANGNRSNSLDAGDLLDLAGDEKFLAAENYHKASQEWDKAATAYTSAGASDEAKIARDNMKAASAAAKRALTDGVYLHMKAKEQYEGTNNLIKQLDALEKAARNLERLSCGFAQCVNSLF